MKRLVYITSVFLTEPCRRAALSAMLAHIIVHTLLAVRVSVPAQESIINIFLRQLSFGFFLRSVAGEGKITVCAMFGFIGIHCAFRFVVDGKHGTTV